MPQVSIINRFRKKNAVFGTMGIEKANGGKIIQQKKSLHKDD
jgi:hypothetical protein